MQDELFQLPAAILASAGSNKYIWQAIIGERIQHRLYGRGTILGIEFLEKPFSVRISVHFDVDLKSADHKNTYIREFGPIAVTESIMTFLNPSLNIMEKARQIYKDRKKELEEARRRKEEKERERKAQIEAAQETANLAAEQQRKAELEQRAKQIRHICTERGIENLVHFTHIQHLRSILKKGLLGRNALNQLTQQHKPSYNDEMRLDGHAEAICLSISSPNYRMFYKYSHKKPQEWVVLLIDAAILWELDCAFCQNNAASSSMINKPLVDKKKVSEFRKMFDDFNQIYREQLNIPKNFPTNPQAEVLVFEPIAPRYIKEVHFYDKEARQKWHGENLGAYQMKLVVNQQFFRPRQDHLKWSSLHLDNTFKPEDLPNNDINFSDEDIPF